VDEHGRHHLNNNNDVVGTGLFDGTASSIELLYSASAAAMDLHATNIQVQDHAGFVRAHPITRIR
jgi:hypothetical protein